MDSSQILIKDLYKLWENNQRVKIRQSISYAGKKKNSPARKQVNWWQEFLPPGLKKLNTKHRSRLLTTSCRWRTATNARIFAITTAPINAPSGSATFRKWKSANSPILSWRQLPVSMKSIHSPTDWSRLPETGKSPMMRLKISHLSARSWMKFPSP